MFKTTFFTCSYVMTCIILSGFLHRYLGHPCISIFYSFSPANTLVASYIHDLDRIEFNKTVFSSYIFA